MTNSPAVRWSGWLIQPCIVLGRKLHLYHLFLTEGAQLYNSILVRADISQESNHKRTSQGYSSTANLTDPWSDNWSVACD